MRCFWFHTGFARASTFRRNGGRVCFILPGHWSRCEKIHTMPWWMSFSNLNTILGCLFLYLPPFFNMMLGFTSLALALLLACDCNMYRQHYYPSWLLCKWYDLFLPTCDVYTLHSPSTSKPCTYKYPFWEPLSMHHSAQMHRPAMLTS